MKSSIPRSIPEQWGAINTTTKTAAMLPRVDLTLSNQVSSTRSREGRRDLPGLSQQSACTQPPASGGWVYQHRNWPVGHSAWERSSAHLMHPYQDGLRGWRTFNALRLSDLGAVSMLLEALSISPARILRRRLPLIPAETNRKIF